MGKKADAFARHAIAFIAGVRNARTAINEYRTDTHVVKWTDWDGKVIDVTEVRHGAMPEHEPPERPSTRRYDYEFDEWYPPIREATEDVTFHPRYLEKDRRRKAIVFGFYNHVTKRNSRFVTYYSDMYFRKPSTEYNPSMTTFAMAMALSSGYKCMESEDNALYARNLLKDIGCDRISINDYYLADRKDLDNIGVAIGVKGKVAPKVFVILKGSHYGSEFGGNMIVGREDEFGGRHAGFASARDRAIEFIRDTMREMGLSGKRVRMVVCGYSRGGAVTNLVSSYITDRILDGTIQDDMGVRMDRDGMYGFCFEPALCQYDTDSHEDRYPNILCVIDPNDIVTKVPPARYGFTLYGRKKILPSNDPESVREMIRYMEKYFGYGISAYYNIPGFVPHSGTSNMSELLDMVMDRTIGSFGDRDYYVEHLQDDLAYTIYALMENIDEARRAMASLDPRSVSFPDVVSTLFSKSRFIEKTSKYVKDFNTATNTDTKRMLATAGQGYELIKRMRAEDLFIIFVGLRSNYKRIGTPHYPIGPYSFLLMDDPNYRL